MWIKYSGNFVYNSEKVRGVLPKSKVEVNDLLAKKMIKDHPKWFRACPAPILAKSTEGKVEVKEEEEKAEPKEDKDKDKGRRS